MTKSNDKEQSKPWQFKKGEVANPKGRPKGSKNKFTNQFYEDLLLEWQEGGREVMKEVRENDPATFLRVAASLVPKDIKVTKTDDAAFDSFMEGLDDDELDKLIAGLCAISSSGKGKERETKKIPAGKLN